MKLNDFDRPLRIFKDELTFEKALEKLVERILKKFNLNYNLFFSTISSREGITEEAARLLTERLVRRGAGLFSSSIFCFQINLFCR